MTRPELYRWLRDDDGPDPEEFYPNASPHVHYVLAWDDAELLGVVITHPINTVCWEVHHAILPSAWGARAHAIGLEFERWLWANTPAETAAGFTPACNRLALRYARQHGMRETGRIPRAYRRGGELFDLVVFAKTRN